MRYEQPVLREDIRIRRQRDGVVAAVVGPVTAQPLIDAGIRPIMPERYRMGALIRLVVEHLSAHLVARYATALGEVQIRGGPSCWRAHGRTYPPRQWPCSGCWPRPAAPC